MLSSNEFYTLAEWNSNNNNKPSHVIKFRCIHSNELTSKNNGQMVEQWAIKIWKTKQTCSLSVLITNTDYEQVLEAETIL